MDLFEIKLISEASVAQAAPSASRRLLFGLSCSGVVSSATGVQASSSSSFMVRRGRGRSAAASRQPGAAFCGRRRRRLSKEWLASP